MALAFHQAADADPDDPLDRIAASLEAELQAQIQAIDAQSTDAAVLIEVAETLGNQAVRSDLETQVQALKARRDELCRALRLLQSRPCSDRPAPSLPEEPREEAGTATLTDDRGGSVRPATAGAETGPTAMRASASTGPPADDFWGDSRPEPSKASSTPAAFVKWSPRPLEELERERAAIEESVDSLPQAGESSLVRLKTACCRFKGALEERQRWPGIQDEWRALDRALREKVRSDWPNRYCIPLSPDVRLDPDRWKTLASLYGDLALATEAWEWIEARLDPQGGSCGPRDCLSVAEAIGAVTSRLYRWLRQILPHQRDDQQEDLYHRLCDFAVTHRHFIYSLRPEDQVRDSELEALAADLPQRFQKLRTLVERRSCQEEALCRLLDLLRQEGFGSSDDDDDRLCEAASDCLGAGIPPTDKRLRDALLEYDTLLEDDPRLGSLHAAVVAERSRREEEAKAAAASEPDSGPRLEDMTSELQQMLAELLPQTRDRKGLIVGGICREANRRLLEQALQFSELRWPNTDPSDSFERSAAEIARAEVVFLTRFNRKQSKEAIRLCRDQGKSLIRLPKGYGLNEVISQAYRQLFPRTGKPEDGPPEAVVTSLASRELKGTRSVARLFRVGGAG